MKTDKSTGKKVLRHYGRAIKFNYGMIPQTWENSQWQDKVTGCYGDNDPIDVVDLTDKDMPLYHVPNLKVLGILCLIDQDELDWKVLAMDEAFAKDRGIRDINQYKQQNPGAVEELMEWFRTIKTFDGKPENRFAYDDQVLSVEKTIEVIHENHQSYHDLIGGKIKNDDNLAF